jgi:hypothetical protein
MTEKELRTAIDDADWARATAEAEIVARDGDAEWLIIPLDDGERWAAITIDTEDVDTDAIAIYPTRLAALAAQWAQWLRRVPRNDTPRRGWLEASEWLTPDQVTARYGLADGGVVRTARHRDRIHPAAIWQIHGKAWLVRAEEAERVWGAAARRAGAGKAR